MLTNNELANMNAIALADLVRKKEVKPIELVEETISRIEQLNPQINVVTTRMYDQARSTAHADIPEGPLAGVPTLLQDIRGAYAGVPQTQSSRFLQDYVPVVQERQLLQVWFLFLMQRTGPARFGFLLQSLECSG